MTKRITFSLPAEAVQGASEVKLLGDFNNWNPENAPRLERQADGSYKAVTELEAGRTYHYRFLLDNGNWVNDYSAQQYENVPGFYIDNCVINVPEATEVKHKAAQPVSTVKAIEKATSTTPVAKKATKKAPAKDDALVAKKAKSVEAKSTAVTKADKPAKAAKKAAPKAKK
ncbi:MAG: isoamylase early set domain-containing protein [Ginsengibacter sp.]